MQIGAPNTSATAQADATSQKSSATQAASGVGGGVSKEMFLQLLVAQIKNQDPLNPSDSMQFVSQLAQFSELEQVLGMRQDIGALRDKYAPQGTSGTGGQGGGGTQGSGTATGAAIGGASFSY